MNAEDMVIYRTCTSNPNIKYPIWPIRENMLFRNELAKRSEADPEFAKAMYALCKRDIIFWIDNTCYTKDTRIKPPVGPFICYEFQIPAILEIEAYINGQLGDLGIDKSRDMGISWIVLYVLQHQFQFSEGADFRVGSRKEDFVDKIGVIDTLLEKVRFNLEKQPMFLMPNGFESESEFKDNTTYMRLINKARSNSIIGESANPHFGSGGRSKAVVLDEFAKWEKGVDVNAWTSTADVTGCRIAISTPNGAGNKFAQLMNGTKEKIKKLHLHWTLHPKKAEGAYYLSEGTRIPIDLKKDSRAAYKLWEKGYKVRSPWYDQEAERRTATDLAQEVDINYHQSGGMFFSSKGLSIQTPWVPIVRSIPDSQVPYGKYITGKLVELDDKVKFIECDEEAGGWLRVFELPKPNHQYTLAGDTAEGLLKGDESFGVAIDKSNSNTVASWNVHIPPEDFSAQLRLVGWWFNECDIAPENNNHGYTTCKDLEGKSHVKLYHTKSELSGETTKKRGFSTTNKTRPEMLNRLAQIIDKASGELRCPVLIAQCYTFIRNGDKGGKPEASGSFLDDGVIARAIADYVTEELPYEPTGPKHVGAQREAVEKRLHHKNAGFGFGRSK